MKKKKIYIVRCGSCESPCTEFQCEPEFVKPTDDIYGDVATREEPPGGAKNVSRHHRRRRLTQLSGDAVEQSTSIARPFTNRPQTDGDLFETGKISSEYTSEKVTSSVFRGKSSAEAGSTAEVGSTGEQPRGGSSKTSTGDLLETGSSKISFEYSPEKVTSSVFRDESPMEAGSTAKVRSTGEQPRGGSSEASTAKWLSPTDEATGVQGSTAKSLVTGEETGIDGPGSGEEPSSGEEPFMEEFIEVSSGVLSSTDGSPIAVDAEETEEVRPSTEELASNTSRETSTDSWPGSGDGSGEADADWTRFEETSTDSWPGSGDGSGEADADWQSWFKDLFNLGSQSSNENVSLGSSLDQDLSQLDLFEDISARSTSPPTFRFRFAEDFRLAEDLTFADLFNKTPAVKCPCNCTTSKDEAVCDCFDEPGYEAYRCDMRQWSCSLRKNGKQLVLCVCADVFSRVAIQSVGVNGYRLVANPICRSVSLGV